MVSLLGGAARHAELRIRSPACTSIERTLAERGQALISEFQTRAEALDTGTQKLNAALEARARQINETLVERAREIATTFTDGKQTLVRHDRRGQGAASAPRWPTSSRRPRPCSKRAPAISPAGSKLRATSCRAPSTPTSSGSPRPAPASTRRSKTTRRKLAESRDRMAAALQADLAEVRRRPRRDRARRRPAGPEAGRRPQPDVARPRGGSAQDQRARATIDAALGGQLERLARRPRTTWPGR